MHSLTIEEYKNLGILMRSRDSYHILQLSPDNWLDAYNDKIFFDLFRMKKQTFNILHEVLLSFDKYSMFKKSFRGGNKPVPSTKSLLIFLWYISKQDTLNSIAEQFRVVPSTIMHIINNLLYITGLMKNKYICWPNSDDEYQQISREFTKYPGVIGALDGSHIKLKVPINQHDSYMDRYSQHSINVMAICTARNIFTYVFIGFPGSAHDSRVISNSRLVQEIERYGKQKFFPHDKYHVIGDSAFPLQTWLMTPYKKSKILTREQKHHNYCLSSDRVCIEHSFGILKGRWRRLQFINTYSISKAIEIATAACILHNFCYLHADEWTGEGFYEEQRAIPPIGWHQINEPPYLGKIKRDNIARDLLN